MDWFVLLPGLVAVVAASLRLSVIDYREHRLPNRITGPLAAGVAVWILLLGALTDDFGRSFAALGWGFAGFGVFLLMHLPTSGVGMGDVKFAWPICATLGWFGWPSLRLALFVLLLSGGLVGMIDQISSGDRKRRIAYGPLMAFGMVCGIAAGLAGV